MHAHIQTHIIHSYNWRALKNCTTVYVWKRRIWAVSGGKLTFRILIDYHPLLSDCSEDGIKTPRVTVLCLGAAIVLVQSQRSE